MTGCYKSEGNYSAAEYKHINCNWFIAYHTKKEAIVKYAGKNVAWNDLVASFNKVFFMVYFYLKRKVKVTLYSCSLVYNKTKLVLTSEQVT